VVLHRSISVHWLRQSKNAEMNSVISVIESVRGIYEITVDPFSLDITREQIFRELGYAENAVPEFFSEQVDEILEEYCKLCDIRAAYRVVDVSAHRGQGLLINNTFFDLNKIIAFQIKNAEMLALFICTIGTGMESWSSQLFSEGDGVRAHFVDTIASAAVEKATDIIHDHIEQQMVQKGLAVTNRFSPGYCGWSVSQQHLLFSFFPSGCCGIELTESSLMIPRKSTSGIIGIGSSVKREPYFCGRCTKKDCTYRLYRQWKDKKGTGNDPVSAPDQDLNITV